MRFGALNVHGGLDLKVGTNDFIEYVKDYDILFLSECWTNESSVIDLKYFDKPICKHRKRKKSGKRDSGGLCCYFKPEVIGGVTKLEWDFEDGLVFKLSKNFFGWERDAYLFCIYMRDSNSTRENLNDGLNCYDLVLEQIAKLPQDADIFAMGDWNGRVGDRFECKFDVVDCNALINDPVFDFEESVHELSITENDLIVNNFSIKRTNKDLKVNDYGIKLLNLCETVNFCILNGRAFQDKNVGEFTFCNKRGKSVIDYVLCNKNALSKINDFYVKPFNVFSDHSLIGFDVKYFKHSDIVDVPFDFSLNNPFCFTKWDDNKKDEFISCLESENIQNSITYLADNLMENMNRETVDSSIQDLNSIFEKAGEGHINRFYTGSSHFRKDKKGGAKWYDSDCLKQREIFSECEKRFWETKDDDDRIFMCEQRRIYRELCRDKKRKFNQGEASKMVMLSKNDPKRFWREVKGINIREKAGNCNFYDHFRDLANVETRVGNEVLQEVKNDDTNDYNRTSDVLDTPIVYDELEEAINGLKKNKAAGPDNIINEFFLNASVELKLLILVLFNVILKIEYFPSAWALGNITPVFKKGNKNDPNNYRGISVISCLAKLFTKIINDRLNCWVEEEKILSDVQYGFRKNRSTIDCIFILKGLIDIIFARGLKLYVCFIDYQKAYDLIDRSCLFHKLMKEGVSSKIINVYRDFYSKIKLTVKNDEFNRYFSSNVGLLQGESTSPLLFSLFVNDLENSVSTQFNNAFEILVQILMFADDMAVFSTTREGLQQGLDNLRDYCKKWGITVNIIKTKVVVFRKGGKLGVNDKWYYDGNLLEVVSVFKYLGIVFSSSGSFKHCINDLLSSARRALFSLKRYFSSNPETLPDIQLELFSKMVVSILNYGSEVWGLRQADPLEKFHLSFLKSVLGVKTSTPNCFVYGELGVYPLLLERKMRVLKYWLKIVRCLNVKEHYVHKVYKELCKINIDNPNAETWVSHVKHLLESNGFGYVWQNQGVDNERDFLKLFKQRLCDIYIQDWHNEVTMTSDGRLYKHIKQEFCFESYLHINNKALRISISKIRLSSNLFLVERGRWGANRVERRERICTVCKCVEDEYHCLLECPRFNNERRGLLPDFIVQDRNIINFIKMLSTDNVKEQRKLGLLCFKIQKEYRESVLNA